MKVRPLIIQAPGFLLILEKYILDKLVVLHPCCRLRFFLDFIRSTVQPNEQNGGLFET